MVQPNVQFAWQVQVRSPGSLGLIMQSSWNEAVESQTHPPDPSHAGEHSARYWLHEYEVPTQLPIPSQWSPEVQAFESEQPIPAATLPHAPAPLQVPVVHAVGGQSFFRSSPEASLTHVPELHFWQSGQSAFWYETGQVDVLAVLQTPIDAHRLVVMSEYAAQPPFSPVHEMVPQAGSSAGMEQVPTRPARLQAWQTAPSQLELQHTPSVQKPDAH